MPHGAHPIPLGPFGNTGLRPSSLCSFERQLWVHRATGVARLLLFPSRSGSTYLSRLSRPGRRGHIRFVTNRRWLLRPSQGCSCWPCLAVGLTTTRVVQARSFSMFCIHHTGGFRSALYTGSLVSSRRNDVKHPVSTAYLLVPACQLSFGWSAANDACKRSLCFNHVLLF
jgi:hypothetical protein